MPKTDRPIVSCPETQNHLRANKITSRNKINSGNSYPQVQQHMLKTPKIFVALKKCWIKEDMYLLCSWTYQRLLTDYITI